MTSFVPHNAFSVTTSFLKEPGVCLARIHGKYIY